MIVWPRWSLAIDLITKRHECSYLFLSHWYRYIICGDTSDSDPSIYFNQESIYDFEEGTPETRGVFSVKHAMDDFSVTARLSYYGEYSQSNDLSSTPELDYIQDFDSEFMFDLEGSYYITESITLSAGVRNLFDNYPEPGTIGETTNGRIYRSDSIVDWQGGYYYAKFNYTF